MAAVAPLTRVLEWVAGARPEAGSSSPSPHRAEPGLRVVVPVWGFVVTLLLVVGSSVLSLIEVSRAQRDVIDLFRRGERTTYLIGRNSRALAQSIATLREAVSGDPDTRAQAIARAEVEVPRLASNVAADARELGPLLSEDSRGLWSSMERDEKQLIQSLLEALHHLQKGNIDAADRILDRTVPSVASLYDRLHALSVQNQLRIETDLRDAESRLEFVKLAELVLGAVLLGGVVAAWSFAIRTIREQRRELGEYVVGIETARRDLDAFAGRAAHDLRNAIAPLPLAALSLRRNADKPESVQTVAGRVERSSLRASALLDALLAFSRAGKPSEEHSVASLDDAIRVSIEGLRPLIESVGARVQVSVPRGLSFAIAPALLDSVVTNLLNNAVKFLEGRPRREVRISARYDDQCGVLVVGDTGPGIPPDALEKLFQPFYRVPGTSAPGTGIGLATVQRIVQAHAGQVRVTSTVGEGARFEVRLPLA